MKCPSTLKTGIAAALLLLGAGSAAAQDLMLPVPTVELSTDTRRNILIWDEVTSTAGRDVTNLVFEGFDATTPAIGIVGNYAVDCDYRLRVTKEPLAGFDQAPTPTLPSGREVRVKLRYQLWTNQDNIGSPLVEDSLDVREPDVAAFFDSDLVGPLGLGLTIGDNVVQPTTSLGNIPVTVTGLGAGPDSVSNYMITAEAPGTLTSGGGALTVRVFGPFETLPPPVGTADSTFTITAANTPVKVMDGMSLTFGTGSTAPGDTVAWSTTHIFPLATNSKIEADLEAFEGYHVWRSDLPNVESGFTLLGEVVPCNSKFDIFLLDENEISEIDIQLDYDPTMRRYTLTDRDVHDDFPYRYAVSTFDRGFLGNRQNQTFEGTLATTEKVYPAVQTQTASRAAYVVPNPYKRSAAWEEGGEAKIAFANLPVACTIRIFTVAAEHIATIVHGPGQPRSTSPTSTSWNLVTTAGENVAPGIYIFYIESADGFRQSGKMIIAR